MTSLDSHEFYQHMAQILPVAVYLLNGTAFSKDTFKWLKWKIQLSTVVLHHTIICKLKYTFMHLSEYVLAALSVILVCWNLGFLHIMCPPNAITISSSAQMKQQWFVPMLQGLLQFKNCRLKVFLTVILGLCTAFKT